jgi:alpha-beta hydrolase superfamily lysophospholipase
MRLEQLPFRSWRSLWRGAIVVIVMLAIWLLVSLVVAYRLTCRGRPRFDEPTPRPAWGQVEGHRIKTSDGEEIGAWFVDNRDNTPSVLLLHGNNGNRRNSLRRAEMLASQGYAVLMISLRAHGDSTGKYNDIGFGARHDVWAAVEFLKARRTNRPVIIIGNSMGSAAAIFAAGTLGHQVAGYILESPYQDLKVAVWNRTDNSLWPGLSHAAYLGLRVVGPLFVPHMDEISPLKAIIGIPDDVPVLILAGDADRHARPEEAQALYQKVATHGKLLFFRGAGHGDLFGSAPELYSTTVLEFCRQVSKRSMLGGSRSSVAPVQRLGAAIQRLVRLEPDLDRCGVIRRKLETEEPPTEFSDHHQRGAAAAERVEDDFSGLRASADDPAQDLLGHLAAMPASALLECSADVWHIPGISFLADGTRISPSLKVKRLGSLTKCVATGEFPGAMDPKRIVLNHPASQRKSQLVTKQDLELGGKLVADRQPERAAWLEDTHDLTAPGQAPVKVGLGVASVVVDIVIIADVKGRVGENQVDCPGFDPGKEFLTVTGI